MTSPRPVPSLRELIDQIFSGSADAAEVARTWEMVMRRAAPVVDELCRPLHGQRWGEYSVTDLQQEVLQRCFENLRSFRGSDDEFSAWLAEILRNRTTDLIRRASSRRPQGGAVIPLNQLDDGTWNSNGVPEPGKEDPSAGGDEQWDHAVARLTEEERSLVEQRYVRNMGTSEIAAELKINPTTVRRRLDVICRKLESLVVPPR